MDAKDLKIVGSDAVEEFKLFFEDGGSFDDVIERLSNYVEDRKLNFTESELSLIEEYNVTRVASYPDGEISNSGWFYIEDLDQIVTWVNSVNFGFCFYTWPLDEII